MELEKYSLGVGDRFGYQGVAQLRAVQKAVAKGLAIAPAWNKSHREHRIAGTIPEHQKKAADEAVKICGWDKPYYVDADHIGQANVDGFLPFSNFFTIDVADFIGKPAPDTAAASFLSAEARDKGLLPIPGMQAPVPITDAVLADFAQKYLNAISEAGKVYRYIVESKGSRFAERIREARAIIEENVTNNLYDKHIVPLFIGS